MRNVAIIMIIFLLIPTSTVAKSGQPDEMTRLASLITKEEMTIDSWQVIIKESIAPEKADAIYRELDEENGYLVSREENESAVNYSISDTHKNAGFSESYILVVPKNAKLNAQLSLKLKGPVWNESIKQAYLKRLSTIKDAFFSKKSTIFACLTAALDDKIGSVYFFDEFAASLDLKNVIAQKDNVKNSTIKKIIYGYIPLWPQKMKPQGAPVNFQMVLHNMENGKSKLTLGTPILITEY